MVDAEKSIKER